MSLDQASHGNLVWKIAGGLIVIVALAGTFMWMNTKEPNQFNSTSTETPAKTATALQTTESSSSTVSAPAPVITIPVDTSEPKTVNDKALVNESILAEKIPEQSALAKEEIAKLDDIQKQLVDQQHTLEAQQQDADQLIQLKEEQIKLLEQQLSAQN